MIVDWGGVGKSLGSLAQCPLQVGKETGAAVVAQRDANPQSGGCFYVGSEWRKGT